MLRRTQTVYVAVDSFLSPRGKVLRHFDQLLEGLAGAQVPCIWMTGWTRAQLDEPRRRLGQNDPYIGENGCGVYLPEDYFHLKGSKTVRLGRYTCIPLAKPQPAAAEALEELSSDLQISVVPLRSLSQRELSQNTGLSGKEAELVRMRDFDELFFFAGASDAEIGIFQADAKARGLTLQRAGTFWSLSCGADLGKCVRELGALYDRALRGHALRVGLRMGGEDSESDRQRAGNTPPWPKAAFDRTVPIVERLKHGADTMTDSLEYGSLEDSGSQSEIPPGALRAAREFHVESPTVWDDVLDSLLSSPSAGAPRTSLFR